MPNLTRWPVSRRILAGALILYSALLGVLSSHVFYTTIHAGPDPGGFGSGGTLDAPGVIVFTLTLLFPLFLVLALWRPRLASAMLLAGAAVLLALTLAAPHHTGSASAGVVGASLLFLGVPMLGAAILFQRSGRRPSSPER